VRARGRLARAVVFRVVARLPYVDPEEASPRVRKALEALPPLNIFRMLAHAESAFVPYLRFGGALLAQLELDPGLRELAILLVAARTGAQYEWVQHVGIAEAVGVADEQIAAVRRGELEAACFDADARVMLRFASEVLDRPRAEEETFAALSERFPPRQIVELLLVIGSYQMLAHAMTTLDIDIDPAVGAAVIDGAARRRGGQGREQE
jgi:4-carboxymuconolactone decarboxylase